MKQILIFLFILGSVSCTAVAELEESDNDAPNLESTSLPADQTQDTVEETISINKVGFEFGLSPEFQSLWEIDLNSPSGTRCTSLEPNAVSFKMILNDKNITTDISGESIEGAPLGWRAGQVVSTSNIDSSYSDWEDLPRSEKENLVKTEGIGACVGLQTVSYIGNTVGNLQLYINDELITEYDDLTPFKAEELLQSRRSISQILTP